MATEIYLGNPPQHVIDWIKAHSKPVVSPETKITFTNGTSYEYLIEGAMDIQALVAEGLMRHVSGSGSYWIKQPIEVEIGSAVIRIGDSVFYNCSGLTSVTIPNSVTDIGGFVFRRCSRLTSVTIPSSVTNIGDDAFNDCSGLTSIVVEGKTTAQARKLLENAGLSDINIVTGSIPG